ncbi:type II toxin-antitoxin system VapC family toxin [Microcystis aeruginosa]|uniref:Type II toxin-antitoxin system VapC family toxin n=2 Tax=Microcystis aeruginosa TaxID=1126 RepID=A0A841V590_MICAE|nr:type II toxin-antitoxin system VapC family toxin [Microcystis aeruginosa]MBC1195386.1 type II toxin-antitoxin system VapC family toxin [Microcystis aeruginosa BLCC-F158]GCA81898.1 ribonuclease VapC2 [Microcystis aeruginosa NIES-2521]
MMYLLDTDTLTHLHSGNTNVINRLENLQDEEVAITIVTKIEILRGRIDYLLKAFSGSDLLKAQELFSRSETLLNQLPVILIDPNAANQFDRLQDISKFRKIGRSDLLIASIALANQAQLVTRNLRHFRQIPHLFLENWVD